MLVISLDVSMSEARSGIKYAIASLAPSAIARFHAVSLHLCGLPVIYDTARYNAIFSEY
jgi:hypothetical protein